MQAQGKISASAECFHNSEPNFKKEVVAHLQIYEHLKVVLVLHHGGSWHENGADVQVPQLQNKVRLLQVQQDEKDLKWESFYFCKKKLRGLTKMEPAVY